MVTLQTSEGSRDDVLEPSVYDLARESARVEGSGVAGHTPQGMEGHPILRKRLFISIVILIISVTIILIMIIIIIISIIIMIIIIISSSIKFILIMCFLCVLG